MSYSTPTSLAREEKRRYRMGLNPSLIRSVMLFGLANGRLLYFIDIHFKNCDLSFPEKMDLMHEIINLNKTS